MGVGPYRNKPVRDKHTETGVANGVVFGTSCMQGWRKTMEDAELSVPEFKVPGHQKPMSLFGVFDGHGGFAVAKMAAAHLPKFLADRPEMKTGDYQNALTNAFVELDAFIDSPQGRAEIREICAAGNPQAAESENLATMVAGQTG